LFFWLGFVLIAPVDPCPRNRFKNAKAALRCTSNATGPSYCAGGIALRSLWLRSTGLNAGKQARPDALHHGFHGLKAGRTTEKDYCSGRARPCRNKTSNVEIWQIVGKKVLPNRSSFARYKRDRLGRTAMQVLYKCRQALGHKQSSAAACLFKDIDHIARKQSSLSKTKKKESQRAFLFDASV